MTTIRPDKREAGTPDNPAPPAEPDQEVDIWWGAYSTRTMLPTFLLSILLSVNIGLLTGWLWDEELAHPQLMWHLAVLLIALVWVFPLLLCGYRAVTYTYRLTTHRLFRDRGLHCPADGEVPLDRVRRVGVGFTSLERLVGVGQVWVEYDGGTAPLVLNGVYDPQPVADLIQAQAAKARGRQPPGPLA